MTKIQLNKKLSVFGFAARWDIIEKILKRLIDCNLKVGYIVYVKIITRFLRLWWQFSAQ